MKYIGMSIAMTAAWLVSGFLIYHGTPPGILWGTVFGSIVIGISFNPEAFD